jgi:hypothetical protein
MLQYKVVDMMDMEDQSDFMHFLTADNTLGPIQIKILFWNFPGRKNLIRNL